MVGILSISSLLLTGYYLFLLSFLVIGWARLKPRKTLSTGLSTKVTVLIAARNEEKSIHLTIGDILAQDYPKHLTEIIIVDDHSTDSTAEIISSYGSQGIKLLQLNEDKPLNSYKKKAISEAIKLSSGDLMVATDADCRMGTRWLSAIVSCYENEDLLMISSPVTYFEERSLFEYMQTLEFDYLVGIGAAMIGNKRASNCNGANLAYRKDVFYAVGGFAGIDDIASGDDELLLQKVAQRYPGKIGFLKNRDAIVYTHAKHTPGEFLQQRRRWASKTTKYKDKKVVIMVTEIWLFNLSLLINFCLGFYDGYFFKLYLFQLLLKFLFELTFLFPITLFFRHPKRIVLLLLISPFHMFYIVFIGLMGNSRQYVWKDRVVR